jgi:hypothetical protein
VSTTASGSPPPKFGQGKHEAVATGDQFSTRTTPSPPLPVSDEEDQLYYAGLPSKPVARTGTTPYETPTGPEADPKFKELWEDDLAFKVHAILGENKVKWTSTDVIRIGYVEESSGNVILWIRVKPDSLSYEQGIDVTLQCKRLLLDYGINDVDVEIHQSEVIRSAGPQLLRRTFDIDPTVDVREPFTATLGITLSPSVLNPRPGPKALAASSSTKAATARGFS